MATFLGFPVGGYEQSPLLANFGRNMDALPAAGSDPQKRSLYARMFDRLNPGGAGMSDDDKQAAIRQGLLGLAAGMASTGGQGLAGAIGNGLQTGLLAMNKGRDDLLDREQREKHYARALGDPAGMREFNALTEGLSDADKLAARRVKLGLDGRASSAGFSLVKFTGPDGRERIGTLDGSKGVIATPDGYAFDARQVGGLAPVAPQAAQQPTFTGPDGMPISFGADIPDAVRQSIMADPAAWQELPDGANAQLPEQQVQTFTPKPIYNRTPAQNPFVGRAPEETAAATEAAKQAAALSYLPQELGLRTQAALDEAQGKASITAQADTSKAQAEKDATFNLYETAMAGVSRALDNTVTGPGIGILPGVTASQQTADGAVAALAPVLKQLFRASGEGTFTDKDQELLLKMVPTRNDHPEARKAKLANIDSIVRAKLGQGGQRAPAQGDPRRALLDRY